MSPNNAENVMPTPSLPLATMSIDAEGWCPQAVRRASPNHDVRPDGKAIDLLVIHNVSLPPGQFGGPYIEALFENRLDCDAHPYFDRLRSMQVSAHFLIRRDGSVLQFVSTLQRAWHAGVSEYAGEQRCNDFSIGIELEGSDDVPFEAAQYASLAMLTVAVKQRHVLKNVVGHEHVAAGRKTDPGPFFEWGLYCALYAAYANQREFNQVERVLPHGSSSSHADVQDASVLRFFPFS